MIVDILGVKEKRLTEWHAYTFTWYPRCFAKGVSMPLVRWSTDATTLSNSTLTTNDSSTVFYSWK